MAISTVVRRTAVLLLAIVSPYSMACSCVFPPDPSSNEFTDYVSGYDVIFLGEAVDVLKDPLTGEPTWTIRVFRQWKGNIPSEIQFVNRGEWCGLIPRKHVPILMYGFRNPDGTYRASMCASGTLRTHKSHIGALERIF